MTLIAFGSKRGGTAGLARMIGEALTEAEAGPTGERTFRSNDPDTRPGPACPDDRSGHRDVNGGRRSSTQVQ